MPGGDETNLVVRDREQRILVSFVTQKREFCITCVCSAYRKPTYGTVSIHKPEFLPKRLSKLNHQTHFPINYHSTYTFVKLLFILRHLASISPALPNLSLRADVSYLHAGYT